MFWHFVPWPSGGGLDAFVLDAGTSVGFERRDILLAESSSQEL
ncbi:hypothetical protein [Lacrimispora sp. 210928-DFI.3.58]|nr:hypothetical protein [Lacrimispora sp. 210928-DFI.3.58]